MLKFGNIHLYPQMILKPRPRSGLEGAFTIFDSVLDKNEVNFLLFYLLFYRPFDKV